MKKIILFTAILVMATCLSACGSYEEDYATDEATEEYIDEESETEEPYTESELPTIAEGELPICMGQLASMLDDEGDDSDLSASLPELDEETILVTYQVSGNEISSPEYASNVPDELVSYQSDTAAQEYIWQFFTALIPADQRAMVGEFIVFSDGYANTIGAVDEVDRGNLWTLEMDIVDSQDLATMATTLVHEFAHMLTLNDQQINNQSTCENFVTVDGCSNSDSYLNLFYTQFWSDIYDEWADTVDYTDGEVDDDQVLVFYEDYSDMFVSDYAPTGPEEDIAESFLYFVFSDQPSGNDIAQQKILFFYGFPELVDLRNEMLNALCAYTSE